MGKVKKSKVPSNYTNEDLEKALKELNTGKTLGCVSKQYNIPKSTLFDKKKGITKPVIVKKGPKCVLGDENEKRLVDWIFYMCKIGFPASRNRLKDGVQSLLRRLKKNNNFTNDRPGRHWLEGFFRRHPEVSEMVSQNMTLSRASLNEEKIRDWFEQIKSYLISKNLLDIDASRVFSCDETAFELCPERQIFIQQRQKSPYNFVVNDKECLTAMMCGSASGQLAPPMMIFTYKRMPESVSHLMPEEWGIGRSDSGWMTSVTFYEWMTNVFDKWLTRNNIERPIVLYLDGHRSHLTLELSDFCRENGIELIGLFSNSTNVLQPLENVVFHPLKDALREIIQEWRSKHNGARVRRDQFAGILKEAIDGMNWKKILPNGFRTTGLYPFSSDGVNCQKKLKQSSRETLEKSSFQEPAGEDLSRITHLEYVERNIDSELLHDFKLIDEESEWTGDNCHKSLFLLWRKIKSDERSNENGKIIQPVSINPDSQ